MEHGITPSSLARRVVLDAAPEAIQGAVAAGLLATGSRFLGVAEQTAQMLKNILEEAANSSELSKVAENHVQAMTREAGRIPGFGHNLHAKLDPRVDALINVARLNGLAGSYVAAFEAIASIVSRRPERPLLPNAAGAVGAVLGDLGYEPEEVRGFALVARTAGLFAHVVDEQRHPIARAIWERAHHSNDG